MTGPGDFEDYDDEPEPDEFEEAMANCSGFFELDVHCRPHLFMCGAVGSEDCDECPFSNDIGLTIKEIEARDEAEGGNDV